MVKHPPHFADLLARSRAAATPNRWLIGIALLATLVAPACQDNSRPARIDERAAIATRWVPAIQGRIKQFWRCPVGREAGRSALLDLQLEPGGHVVAVEMIEPSGDAAFDASAVEAIRHASPLPVPDGPEFEVFRHFTFRFQL